MHLEKTIELAIRVANHYSMPQVAAKISRIMALRFPPLIDERQYMSHRGTYSAALDQRPFPAWRIHGLLYLCPPNA